MKSLPGMCVGRRALYVLLLLLAAGVGPTAAELPEPGPRDLCPVCGMFVHKYPDWVASLRFRDGSVVHFDGAKDMFRYLTDLRRFAPGRARDQVEVVEVTDYYDLEATDGRTAFYVTGTDVVGPMGHELVPLKNRPDAEEFMRDHHGERLLAFDEVDAAVLEKLGEN